MSAPAATAARPFLGCDWGTSALRLRLVDDSGRVLAARRSEQGIAATFAAWKSAGASPADRWDHFARILAPHLDGLAADAGGLPAGLPLVISGMASSSIGLRELPYAELPFACDGARLTVATIPAAAPLPHPVLLVSGVRSADDVMRGEETQLVGAAALGLAADPTYLDRRIFVLPGTHSKHVDVRAGHAVAFRTFMTGEVFNLLSTHSVLANSVTPNSGLEVPAHLAAFVAGARAGATEPLLHAAFRVRTRALLHRAPAAENFHYLSGTLIGAELRELAAADTPLTLVGTGALLAAYQHAFRALDLPAPLATLDADACLVAGQRTLAARFGAL